MTTTNCQARQVVDRFGTIADLLRYLKKAGHRRARSTIHRWFMPKPFGSAGLVPQRSHEAVKAAARKAGVKVDDLLPTGI